MDELLVRLKRERRWTVAIFLTAAAVVAAIQLGIAHDAEEFPEPPAPPVSIEEIRP